MKISKALGTVLSFIGLIVLVVYPQVVSDPFLVFVLFFAFTSALIALYLNLLIGYGGIFFVAPMIFVGIGGYTTGWLSTKGGVDPVSSVAVGAVLAVMASFIFSLLSTRLRGLYMVLYSVVFQLLVGAIVIQSAPFIFFWTGGPLGIYDIPDVRVGEFAFRTIGGIAYYYVALALLAVGAIVLYAMLNSRFGLAFRSLRDGEVYSTTLGVDSYRLKIYAFAISAFFMGITGGIIAFFLAAVGPAQFQVITVLNFLIILVWGGLGTFMGPIVGALIFVTLDQFLEIYGAWRFIILGLAVIATILIVPRGIMGKIEDLIASRRGQTTTSVPKILLEKARRKESD